MTATATRETTEYEWALLCNLVKGGAYALHAARQTGIRTVHFRAEATGTAFDALTELLDQHGAIDKPLLRRTLRRKLSEADRPCSMSADAVIASLYEGAWTGETAGYHARKIVDAATLAATRESLLLLAGEAERWEEPATAYLAEAQRRLFAIQPEGAKTDKRLSALAPKLWERLQAEYKQPNSLRGIPTGFPTLDRMMRGLCPGHLVVIAGKTGHGKSALSGNIGIHAGRFAPGHIFSLEMAWDELVERYLFAEARVDSQRFRDKTLSVADELKLSEAAGRLAGLPIAIEDNAQLTVSEIVSTLRYHHFQEQCRWAVVDYTQLVSGDAAGMGGSRREVNREREVANIVRVLKATAMELRIPIIALSQLNDQGEARESRSIEQFSDVFLVVKLLDNPEDPGFAELTQQNYDLIVRKCRGGKRGKVPMTYFPSETRFSEVMEGDSVW